MRTVRCARGAVLIVAALALATAWIAVGERPPAPLHEWSPLSSIEHGLGGTVTSADVADLAPTSVLTGHHSVELRLGPLWVLPGLAAALAAVCLLRRLRSSPASPAGRRLLRDSLSQRAPPLGSFA
jgi:hypothetical protein